ncbi:MAG TPA: stage II sporulation protein M [Longimicrobiales bacterium]|nr:stage II sporulation protein M [Longimicrobiales bacterium]
MTTSRTMDPIRTHRVETPEQVDLGFEIADLGSRFTALVLDGVVIGTSLLVLLLLLLWLGYTVDLSPLAGGWTLAAALLLGFTLLWGYFVYWEGYHNGRTPGKRWAGVRVIHDGGHPLTVRGAAIRNLLRVIDAQPAFTWMVGGAVMMLHPRTQRLGDLAAGTLVIRDRGASELTKEELERMVRAPAEERPRLPDEAFEALDRFATGRGELGKEARAGLVARLTAALADHLPPSMGAGAEEERLVGLWEDESGRRGVAAGPTSSPLAVGLARAQARDWIEYRTLVERAGRRGLDDLSPRQLERFAALYRATAADLARARTYGAAWPLVFSLERWVGAGHNLLYRPTSRSWRGLLGWLRHGFPSLVRARRRYVALAALLLFLPAIGVFTAVRQDPALARELLPHGMLERARTAPERARQGGGYVDVPEVFMPVMSSGIIANNVQVTFFAFAGGILAGIGTALLLVVNGISLGAVTGLFHNEGAGAVLWQFVAPHGVIELTAICIAGAAGLLLGSALIHPGRRRRTDALAERAREAVSLLAGTTLLLVLAGLVEGFVSPARIHPGAKLVIAGAVAAGVLAYLVAGGRAPEADPAPDVTAAPGT